MYNAQVIIIVCVFLLIGCLCLSIALLLARCFMRRRVSVGALFIGLKPKLWMTAGLGIFFASLYAAVILGASYLMEPETRRALFEIAYRHPIDFIYAGLTIFVLISLGILVVRSFIKRLYNSSK